MRSGCGPEAPCSRSLAAMDSAHRQALEELQRQHERQIKELETEKDRLLLEETQDTARGQQTGHGRKEHRDQNNWEGSLNFTNTRKCYSTKCNCN